MTDFRISHRSRFLIPAAAGVSVLALTGMVGLSSAAAQASGTTAPATPPVLTGPESNEDQAIVVTGRRAAIENAIARKAASDTIIDSVVADDAGKLPDNSITEVLQRVSGVAIVRFDSLGNPDSFSAQGSGIQVRGLSGVAGRLNGREIFSANGGRGLSFGDVTPELMSAVDVYKSSTADLIEGGTGGQIDLRTKMPFDYKEFTVQGALNSSYGDLRKKNSFGGSLLATDRFETPIGEFGVLLDIAQNKFSQKSNFIRTEPYYKTRINSTDYFIPGGFTYGDQIYDRTRTGIYGALQWRPAQNFKISQTFFQSKYEEKSGGHGIFATSKLLTTNPSTSKFDENNGFISGNLTLYNAATLAPAVGVVTAGGNNGYSDGYSKTTDYSTSFDWQADDRVKLTGAYQHVRSTSGRDAYDLFPTVPFPGTFAVDTSGSLPEITLPSASTANLANPAQYMWNASQDHYEQNRGTLDAFNVDADFDLSDEGFFRTFKAGARYADRSERDLNSGYNWQAFGQGWNGSAPTNFTTGPAEDYQSFVFKNFFRGKANLPAAVLLPSDAAVRRFDVAGDHLKYGNPIKADTFGPLDSTISSSETMAAYALVRFNGESLGVPVQGNVGLRYLAAKNRSDGFFQQNQASYQRNGVLIALPNVGTPRSGSRSYEKLLPSINVQLLPDPKLHLRFGYNVTLDNPSFQALRASGTLSVRTVGGGNGVVGTFDGFTTDSGNPTLKPLISNNLDLSFEWYPKAGTALHAAAFHKSLKNALIYGSGNQTLTVTNANGTTSLENVQSTNVFNATQKATVQGIEAGVRTFLDMLPGVLSGLGIEANYTYIDSKNPGDRYVDINGVTRSDVPFAGLSRHNLNLTGLYEKGMVSARVAYSWRSRYLMSTNSNGTNGDYLYYTAPGVSTFTDISLPIYSEPYGSVDAGLTLRLTKAISVSVQGSNLLNAIAKTSMGGYNNGQRYIRSWFVSDRRFDGTIRFAF